MIPPSSVTLWLSAGRLHMHVPSTVDGGKAHILTFDDDLPGRARVFAILRERERSADLRLATRGSPTQAQLPTFDAKKVTVRRAKPKFKVAPGVAQAAKEVMRRMGMI